ncbi:ribosome biogenesis GTP-binding protein YihA/YsxC [Dinghuibacter silviterrae]|uniref:Probable GTP-binding protein EngB n=1 Tax=Dinghuibacter silviterrae TaxID=1539049 RepID=A0A4R8DQH2_9BACT|nr:ribosome biogenesis GTP-binding protein YihA/YsxC [Dinghuibacter silviterrae]TDX00179.1 GTP-binding protein [Dinghuibacter silviterrae]
MEIVKADYLISSPTLADCPKPDRPEYAFIGRSNVGKSSVLNLLCNRENLAKISSSPGKTRLINHFTVQSTPPYANWYMVDLPGYGFAKVSQSQRKQWEKMIEEYVRKRETLGALFVLIDSRHEPQAIDLEFIARLGEWEVPFALIFTKSDKSTQKEVAANVRAFLNEMRKEWEFLPPHFVTSAVKRTGRKAVLDYIAACNETFSQAGTTSRKPFP